MRTVPRSHFLNIGEDKFFAVFQIRLDEVDLFPGVLEAEWNDRESLQIGRCADVSAFWCADEKGVSVLIGHDDECWGMCLTLPHEAMGQIVDALNPLRDWLATTPPKS